MRSSPSTATTHGLRERYTIPSTPSRKNNKVEAHRVRTEGKATTTDGSAWSSVAEVGRLNNHLISPRRLPDPTFPLKAVGTRLLTVSIHGAEVPAVAFDFLLFLAAAAVSSSLSECVAATADEKKASSSATDVSPAVRSGNCPSLESRQQQKVRANRNTRRDAAILIVQPVLQMSRLRQMNVLTCSTVCCAVLCSTTLLCSCV